MHPSLLVQPIEINDPHLGAAYLQWRLWRPFQLARHGNFLCCRDAEAWFTAMARSCAGRSPIYRTEWIRNRWRWGPSPYDTFWCEAVRRKTIDCGVLAALTETACRALELPIFRVQAIFRHDASSLSHWQLRWKIANQWPKWIWEPYVYHELCGIGDPDLHLWDPTDNRPVRPQERRGLMDGQLVAFRIASRPNRRHIWGRTVFPGNQWRILSDDDFQQLWGTLGPFGPLV